MYATFDAFRPHFIALERAGYFKIVFRKATKWRVYFHNIYRMLVWSAVIIYNLQHIVRAFQVRQCTEQLVGTLFILLTTLNALGKQMAFNIRVKRIDIIFDIITGESFAPTNKYHEDVMKMNAASMSGLLVLYHVAIAVCGSLFTIYPLINRALGQPVFITGYFPFSINESPIFEIVVIFMGMILTLQAYGHVTMDCTVVAFYVQAKTQLQIFRYNLEHLIEETETEITDNIYIDDDIHLKKLLHKKFVNCLKHYEQIIWLVKEVESIFSEATIVQLLVMVWVICMTVYKIVGEFRVNLSSSETIRECYIFDNIEPNLRNNNIFLLSILSAEFVTMAMYLGCMLAQLYIYCYYGTQLKVESELVNSSLYQSAWLSVSPAFRRHLLVMMERCKRTVEPRTAYVIPLSIETFISVLRSSYTLFTILDRK